MQHGQIQNPTTKRIAFELEIVIRTALRIDNFQESYFVLGDLESLLETAEI